MFVSSRLGCRYPFHQFLTFFLPAAALLLTLFSFSSPLSIHWAANINTTTILTLTTHEFFSTSIFLLSLSSQNLEQHFKKSLQRATISSGVTQRHRDSTDLPPSLSHSGWAKKLPSVNIITGALLTWPISWVLHTNVKYKLCKFFLQNISKIDLFFIKIPMPASHLSPYCSPPSLTH